MVTDVTGVDIVVKVLCNCDGENEKKEIWNQPGCIIL